MFVISLYSKYTGETIHLGFLYKTREEAEEADFCERCNSINIHSIPDDFIWTNKNDGFVGKQEFEYIKSERKKDREERYSIKEVERHNEKANNKRFR